MQLLEKELPDLSKTKLNSLAMLIVPKCVCETDITHLENKVEEAKMARARADLTTPERGTDQCKEQIAMLSKQLDETLKDNAKYLNMVIELRDILQVKHTPRTLLLLALSL